MRLKRLWAIFQTRNLEYFRDREAFGWNFLFPFLIIIGFGLIFKGDYRAQFKVGIFPVPSGVSIEQSIDFLPESFATFASLSFVGFESDEIGLQKLKHHKIDLLIQAHTRPVRYWVADSSPSGAIVERLLREALASDQAANPQFEKEDIQGLQIRYVDWLFPGILGMNMMFSALYGVGWVVVRYRKNGVLKRLKATPLTAFEYLAAQLLSRIFLLMVTLTIVWVGCDLILDFRVYGSLLNLFTVFLAGSSCMTALGLVIACRGTSEEFANGILNLISWPMMFLSEVWFSIEGAPDWLRTAAKIFPLTHLLTAARKIMNEGQGLMAVMPEVGILCAMTLAFLLIGAAFFSWNK
ncbi:transport permease protein [Desulfosarcina ovata subsp. sediminis]|uniref:Transport permease protein n=1 Tax=Desulfosarcina ovata subsp. sediminis TaxID=885957 RepID=A0A5K7ZE62_9BACT|nr:ABC transporter permease [Desulfosarcina ovata]BBO80332.1 transport permease protein [Desulfosarcina ovata subsp. sediminis]